MNTLSAEELEARLRDIGARRYHRLHPFHKLLHGGACSKGQVQAWALNRYYYQAMIPIKDASLIARCDDQATRREWRSRLVDHDGAREGEGGIARWLKLTEGLGLDRDYVVSLRGLLPATRFAVDAYVHFVRDKIAARSDRLLAHGIVLAADHQRTHGRHAEELRLRDGGDAGLFLAASAAGRAGLALCARLRQAACPHAGDAAAACSPRSNSNATCSGRCWMRSITPMSRRSRFRPAPLCRRIRKRRERDASAIAPDVCPRLPRGVRLVHNEAQGGWVLLAPERVFKADAIAVEVVKRCTGDSDLRRDRRRPGQDLFGAARAHPRRRDDAAARARRQEAPGIVTAIRRAGPCGRA